MPPKKKSKAIAKRPKPLAATEELKVGGDLEGRKVRSKPAKK
jgi:hypothetical protein